MPILGESANPLPIRLSNANSVPICQSITNMPIHHQSKNPMQILDKSANPSPIFQSMSICQSITNPPIIDQSRVYHTVQCQPNPSPIHQSFTNLPVHVQPTRSINRASAIIHPTVSTGDNQIIPIGTGRHPICQSNVNPVSIRDQFSNLRCHLCISKYDTQLFPIGNHCQPTHR